MTRARARATLATSCVTHFLHDGFSDVVYVLLAVWAGEFRLTFAQVGLLRTAYSGGMASFQVPAGILAERWGERGLLVAGTAVTASGFLVLGLTGGFTTLLLLLLLAGAVGARAGGGALEMRNGYFWDPQTGRPFIARGIAYQSWNPPVGANQSFAQLDYDLREFKKMYANSVRCEMVWNEVQRGPTNTDFDWRKPDFLVSTAEKHGLKLFVLIGFQYAPDWSSEEWRVINDQDKGSVVLSYENPDARLAYSNYIAQVTARY
ncbi:MAG: MFS transporter, partial [Candidatus Rokubacteria bacterium]|nr:MFS transporter [Candidatus Rokubacteria bacterium]